MAGWGAAVGATTEALSGAASNVYAAKQARIQWQRTKKMMKKRHQWEVQDLIAAGLNPILSATGTPSMGSASLATTTPFGAMSGAKAGTELEKALKTMKSEVRKKFGESEKAQADWAHSVANTRLAREQRHLVRQQTITSAADARKKNAEAYLTETQAPGAKSQMELDQSSAGGTLRKINRAVRSITGNDPTK